MAESDIVMESDILMSMEGLLGLSRDEGALRVVMVHQLYDIFPNKTYVDQEIADLKEVCVCVCMCVCVYVYVVCLCVYVDVCVLVYVPFINLFHHS